MSIIKYIYIIILFTHINASYYDKINNENITYLLSK